MVPRNTIMTTSIAAHTTVDSPPVAFANIAKVPMVAITNTTQSRLNDPYLYFSDRLSAISTQSSDMTSCSNAAPSP